jgi:3'(2'), 5'-bisphosphate nucleotidase
MKYERELQVALQAAALAQRLILEHYATLEAIPNAPANITTDTDRQSQHLILEHLHKAFPDDGLCAEETTETLARARRSGPRLWMVDPIDGTRGFARKNGEFAVMVAFLDSGRPAVGVVTEPARQRLTYAVAGAGCWRRDTGSTNPQACRVSSVSQLAQAIVTQSHSRNPNQPSPQLQAIGPSRVMETYSAGIKLAQVARGEADLYLNTYDSCYDWDICAGQLLVEEAGGRVTSLLGQAPRYGLPNSLQPNGLLASNGLLHELALAALREVDPEDKG